MKAQRHVASSLRVALGSSRIPVVYALLILFASTYLAPASTMSVAASPVTAPSSANGTTIVVDQFSRTMSNGWGSAATGGAYSLVGERTNFQVDGAAGDMLVPEKGVGRSAYLMRATAQDVDLRVRVQSNKVATGSGQYVCLIARRITGGTQYQGVIRFDPAGNVHLRVDRVVDGQG